MLTARTDAAAGNYERYYVVTGINEETLRQAKDVFENYRARGVILNESFADDEWLLTNQLQRLTLRFGANEISFKKTAGKWMGCSYRSFVDGMKAYTVFHMGSLALPGLRELVRGLTQLAEKSEPPAGRHSVELLKLLPGGGEAKDRVIEDMEERILFGYKGHTRKRQRVLADFSAYFRFNDALEDFWSGANDSEKSFYFPLYFWWNLTAILPLRPTEFLLTPRECVERKNGENILTVRRTAIKGGGRKIWYSVDGDYNLMKYAIPDKMATEIERYQKVTARMPLSSVAALFAQEPHYLYLGRAVPSFSIYYTYSNLSYCLKMFQESVMNIESDSDERINLGDTRHLAMISLIASGGSPVICKELVGHEDINISARYYANISRFVECATYEMYRKQKGSSVDLLAHRPSVASGKTVEVSGGRCDSADYMGGGISDCIRHMGQNGELGCCASCQHFIDGKSGRHLLFSDAGERRKQVDDDSRYLMRVLEMARKGRGCQEDIQTALLRLQHSSALYSRCLYRNMEGL